jgi:serine/threonine-protein kinase HipA
LEAVAYELTSTRIDNADALRRWLSVLVAPGASLGGARPKANITDTDGSLWIAKFPARDDDRDIGAWEHLTHTLAEQAGIDVPEARVLRLGSRGHATFLVKRFDRVGGRRRFYASAMALLQKDASEGSSYVELAEFLQQNGAAGHIKADLAQLFRRVVFNVAVGNRDDHLRNHGFILTATGWRLAPAFDVNPNVDKAEHVLNLDLDDPRPSLRSVLSTAPWYGLTEAQGRAVVAEVLAVTQPWREAAVRAGIASAEIDGMAAAFEMSDRPDRPLPLKASDPPP